MAKDVLTTHDIAQMLSVNISTVSDWIDQRRLAAYRTPGGHRRVKESDLLSFLKDYDIPLPVKAKMKTVLIVEDSSDFRQMIRVFLDGRGLVFQEAEDGFTAGKMVQALKPDAVVLDLFLPGVNGFRVCEHIRRDPDLAGTRIIAISGQDTPENRSRILAAGADAFLAKPQELPQLAETLEKLLDLPRIAALSK